LVLFNFGGDNARAFQRVSMNFSITVGKAACHLLCRYTQSMLAASCVCWIVPIVTFDSIKRTCGCYVWNAPDQWQNCRVAAEPHRPPAKRNVKTGPLPSLYFGFAILLISVDCCFLRFSECFPVISGFCIAVQYRICYCFFPVFWVLASGLPPAFFLAGSNLTASDQSLRLYISSYSRAMCRATSSILQ